MKTWAMIFTLVAAMLACFVNHAIACSCVPAGPPCQAYWKASAVLVGLVTNISPTLVEIGEGKTKRTYPQLLVRMVVEQAYRGVEGTEVEVVTGQGGGDCGYRFRLGERYLVYAYRNEKDGRLGAGICSRTRPLAEASEDLEYIHGLSNAATGARIFGRVRQNDSQGSSHRETPLKGIAVSIEGQGKGFEAITDDDGKYHVSGLEPGRYRVEANLPDSLVSRDGFEVEVSDRGCAEMDIWTRWNGRISGRVTDAEGHPVPDIQVDLVFADGERRLRFANMVNGDKEGRYELTDIPPGRYLLGLNLNSFSPTDSPYPRTYYPGASDLAHATIIEMGEGQKLSNYDLRLPPKLIERLIKGVVLWPDGRPAVGANVYLEEVGTGPSLSGGVEVDQEGHFSLKGYDGVEYAVFAYTELNGDGKRMFRQMHAEPVEVVATEKPEPVQLVITSPGGTCIHYWLKQKKSSN